MLVSHPQPQLNKPPHPYILGGVNSSRPGPGQFRKQSDWQHKCTNIPEIHISLYFLEQPLRDPQSLYYRINFWATGSNSVLQKQFPYRRISFCITESISVLQNQFPLLQNQFLPTYYRSNFCTTELISVLKT